MTHQINAFCPLRIRIVNLFAVGLWSFLLSTTGVAQPQSSVIQFHDATAKSGIQFVHFDGQSGQQYLFELMTAGLASFDADNDGRVDVYFTNGRPQNSELATSDAYYRNLGENRFQDRTDATGLTEQRFGLGVTAADYDNDGFQDLYISNFDGNSLMHNNGDGTFSDVTTHAGVENQRKFGAGVLFLDADGDGLLDIYAANYVDFDIESHQRIAQKAFPYPPGPRDFPPVPDRLYMNRGDGSFTDESIERGIGRVAGPSMGVISGDFNQDGHPDVFVCCDGAPNFLFCNDGRGKFIECGVELGVAYDLRGKANGSMGVDAADINGDGLEDLLVSDYADQTPMLFVANSGFGFEDKGRASRIGKEVLPHVNWGVGLIDLDNDGDRDAFFCNGHFLRNIQSIDSRTQYKVQNSIMENIGSRFQSGTRLAGQALQHTESSRGGVFDDFDDDGDLDIIILNCDAPAQFLENRSSNSHVWIDLDLRGQQINRDAIGAKVTVHYNGKSQTSEVRSGRGYQSHFGSRLHFGLGDAVVAGAVDIDVQWSPNHRQKFTGYSVNLRHLLIQQRATE